MEVDCDRHGAVGWRGFSLVSFRFRFALGRRMCVNETVGDSL